MSHIPQLLVDIGALIRSPPKKKPRRCVDSKLKIYTTQPLFQSIAILAEADSKNREKKPGGKIIGYRAYCRNCRPCWVSFSFKFATKQ